MREIFRINDSSRIVKVMFNDDDMCITITFKGIKVYRYDSVSEFDFRMFKEDIQNGESRKDARDAKHALKSSDRAQWKPDGQSIAQSIKSDSSDVGDAVSDVAKDIAENPEDLL